MREIVVTVDETCLRIDGELPPGYRLVVHNHTGDIEFYPHMVKFRRCPQAAETEYEDEHDYGYDVPCYFYVDDPSIEEFPFP